MGRHTRPTPEYNAGFDRAYAVLHGADPAQPALPPEVLEELTWEDRVTLDELLAECERIYERGVRLNIGVSELMDRALEAERGMKNIAAMVGVATDALRKAGYAHEVATYGWLQALSALIDDHRLPGCEPL